MPAEQPLNNQHANKSVLFVIGAIVLLLIFVALFYFTRRAVSQDSNSVPQAQASGGKVLSPSQPPTPKLK